jgi:tRNA (guanosine-2'-O-)-methyltransferase
MRSPTGASFRTELPSPVPPHPADALLTPERARKYRQVLARRTARLAVIVEECYDPHNATAIIRTADAFGLHRVFISAGRNGFKVNRRVSQGSHHYLDLRVHSDIASCYADARAFGYAIWATDLSANATYGPERLAPELARRPLALAFGTEGEGLSREASAAADGHFLIPMSGFPQSLNLSVSVAVSLYALRGGALSDDLPGDLPAEEQCRLYDEWVREHKGAAAEKMIRQAGRHGEDLDVIDGR